MKSVSKIGRGNASQQKAPRSPFRTAAPGASPVNQRFGRHARLAKAGSLLALATLAGLAACSRQYTLAFVYAPSETATTSGLINAYGVNNQSGALYLLPDSPIPSGGRKPTTIAAAPNGQAVYISNHDDSNVVEFTIGTDGKLYPQNTYNTTGSFPTALAVSADGKYLYVAYTYRKGFTTASPGPGGISIFPINSDSSLGTPTDFPIGRAAMTIAVSSKPLANGANAVYVAAQDTAATNSASATASDTTLNLFAFSASATDGSLSLLPGETIVAGNSPSFGYATGTQPAGLLEDASGTHLYVTDFVGNTVITYSIGANGVPIAQDQSVAPGGVAVTGTGPMGMAIDPTGKYLYVANYTSGTLSGYTFNGNGDPIPSTVAGSTEAGTGTTCVTIEPSEGIYLYASGRLSNSITGEQIIPTDGSLKPIINSPYAATTLPACTVAVANRR
jgi:6-phosphogluconolactonase (cycloisomerase 2 family)